MYIIIFLILLLPLLYVFGLVLSLSIRILMEIVDGVIWLVKKVFSLAWKVFVFLLITIATNLRGRMQRPRL